MAVLERSAEVNSKNFILIKGVNVHNLKNISLNLPKKNLIVVTGVSGSGKSSLAFDTIYAEGQRRYVESLSAYIRQFMGRISKPNVESIEGITPAIAIQQKTISSNPRSTVGTVTEVYDYLKLLYTRLGKTYSPISGNIVSRDTPESIIEQLKRYPKGTKMILMSKIKVAKDEPIQAVLEELLKEGFTRIKVSDEVIEIHDVLNNLTKVPTEDFFLVVDRFMIQDSEESNSRIYDSLQTALGIGDGQCYVEVFAEPMQFLEFSNRFELDGINFQEPSIHFFSFNSPLGACNRCEGFGNTIGIDPKLVISNPALSVYDNAVDCWKGEKLSEWKDAFIQQAHKFDFPVHTSYEDLSEDQKQVLWEGNEYVEGIDQFFKMVEENSYKIQYRVLLARYRGKTVCPECKGSRLKRETQYVKINDRHIGQLVKMPINKLIEFFKNLNLTPKEQIIAKRLLIEITSRLDFIDKVGLGYLRLDRVSNTLSGGESQRINLATSLGSSLVGSTYILDEPSIGLHSRDSERLIEVLKSLRDLGNTVLVVEHDEEMMKQADLIIDMGPLAGSFGGEVVAEGTYDEILQDKNSLTGKYLSGEEEIKVPQQRREVKNFIEVKGAKEHNLKNIDVSIPLNCISAITGVSGSGKSTLVKKIIYPALRRNFGNFTDVIGDFKTVTGALNKIDGVEFVDQNPIGKSSRSNPVTYVKAYDEIRALYTNLPLSKMRGYKPAYFSFNVVGGRCERCEGEGVNVIEMQFMADVVLPCEECKGKRFKEEILEVEYNNKNISDLLETTIDDAILFFEEAKKSEKNKSIANVLSKIMTKLRPLQKVGLGYVMLGQSSNTLSGGEAQRIKLASFLTKGNTGASSKMLFIFDEPTTGLHFHDVKKLLIAFNELIQRGHTILLIEHHLDVIKCADWVIDLGPEGGDLGGHLLFQGVPEDLVSVSESLTGKHLKEKLG